MANTASSTELGALVILTYYQKVKTSWEGQKRSEVEVKLQESLLKCVNRYCYNA